MTDFNDQANFDFLRSQMTHIVPQVYSYKFPAIQYPDLVPVDTSPAPYTAFVEAVGLQATGEAKVLNLRASDFPQVGLNVVRSSVGVYDAGSAHSYTQAEIEYARRLGVNMSAELLVASRRMTEELIDRAAITGLTEMGDTGLINNAGVTAVGAAATGSGSSPLWANKTPAQILADINDAITRVFDGTNTTAISDTVLLPDARYNTIASTMIPDSGALTILDFIQRANVYTARTGRPLTIRGIRGLSTAGSGGTNRMVAYRNDRETLCMYMPMPFNILPPFRKSQLVTEVANLTRFTKVHFKLPKEAVYVDGI